MKTVVKFENKAEIGKGIYVPKDISKILGIHISKVHYWIDKYWDSKLGGEFAKKYSWRIGRNKAVSFHTLVEFYIMMQLGESGVKPKEVLKAHNRLSEMFQTAFPFAQKQVIDGMKTDGSKVFFELDGVLITLDGTNQFNLNFIRVFFKKLEFDENQIATKFWPLGRKKSVVVDPERKFGHPIISSSNIYPETLYSMFKAGDSVEFLAFCYRIEKKEVKDAIEYCKEAA